MTQEELTELQKETLETVKEYLGNLTTGVNNVIAELKGDMKEDTWEYLRMNLDGLNWVIKAFNGIIDYIDPEKTKFDLKEIDQSVKELSDAYQIKDAAGIANVLENKIMAFLNELKEV